MTRRMTDSLRRFARVWREPSGSRGEPDKAHSAVARRDSASPWGFTVGHSGGGPCYSASAFHAFGLRQSVGVRDGRNRKRLVVQAVMVRAMRDRPRYAEPPRLKQAAR